MNAESLKQESLDAGKSFFFPHFAFCSMGVREKWKEALKYIKTIWNSGYHKSRREKKYLIRKLTSEVLYYYINFQLVHKAVLIYGPEKAPAIIFFVGDSEKRGKWEMKRPRFRYRIGNRCCESLHYQGLISLFVEVSFKRPNVHWTNKHEFVLLYSLITPLLNWA